MADSKTVIAEAYAAFNRRDADGALALMGDHVSWPKASEGGRVVGKDEIRAYWSRQWQAFDPRVEPLEVIDRADGKTHVRVHQLVKSLDGDVLAEGEVWHVHTITNGRIERMDLCESDASADTTRPAAAFAKHQHIPTSLPEWRNPMARILFVGQKPETVDFSDPSLPPGFNAEKINAGIAVAVAKIAERGWQGATCMITPDAAGNAMLEEALKGASYDCVVIGGGLRIPPKSLALFETVVNTVHKAAPKAAIAFNTRPEDTADAAARHIKAG